MRTWATVKGSKRSLLARFKAQGFAVTVNVQQLIIDQLEFYSRSRRLDSFRLNLIAYTFPLHACIHHFSFRAVQFPPVLREYQRTVQETTVHRQCGDVKFQIGYSYCVLYGLITFVTILWLKWITQYMTCFIIFLVS